MTVTCPSIPIGQPFHPCAMRQSGETDPPVAASVLGGQHQGQPLRGHITALCYQAARQATQEQLVVTPIIPADPSWLADAKLREPSPLPTKMQPSAPTDTIQTGTSNIGRKKKARKSNCFCQQFMYPPFQCQSLSYTSS